MDIKILGPLEAEHQGVSVTPSASKPRQLLAVLAIQAGKVVTVAALIEELWGVSPPRSALTTIQTYVMQLRHRIDAAMPSGDGKRLLATRYGGYSLDIGPNETDVSDYERLASGGRSALENGDGEAAGRLLRSALDVWRGPALVDVQVGPRLSMEVTRLEESRLCVLEARIDLDLQCGRHQTLLSELSMLIAVYPMNESLCAQYMIALYRSGRRWRALEAYRVLRATLVNELGIEPWTRLQHLQTAVLTSDPALDESSPEAATVSVACRIVG